MKKFIDITDEQLEEDMMSGVRSLPIEPLTAIERDEIVNLIKEQGSVCISIVKKMKHGMCKKDYSH